jgi:membrane-associated phospholipid phosphatase
MSSLGATARVADGVLLRRISHRSSRPAAALSTITRGGLLWHAASAVLALRGGPARRVALGGSSSWMVTMLTVAAVKRVVQRRRPRWGGSGPPVRSSSMPSSHAATAAAYAAGASMQHPLAAITIAPAGLVAWSRLGTRRRFPTDVAAGVAAGAVLGVAVGAIVRHRMWPVGERSADPGAPAATA